MKNTYNRNDINDEFVPFYGVKYFSQVTFCLVGTDWEEFISPWQVERSTQSAPNARHTGEDGGSPNAHRSRVAINSVDKL